METCYSQAQNEAMHALDFISLLLTKHNTRQAESSLSPYIKQNIPSGSVEASTLAAPQITSTNTHDVSLVSRGWKLQSYHNSARKMLQSSKSLETEVAQEKTFWEEILEIKKRGWKITRLPRARHVLAVQLGFMESAPTFRERGLVALRRGADGRIVLDQGAASTRPCAVKVSVYKDDVLLGSSKIDRPTSLSQSSESIVDKIIRARNSLFEEELFYELQREARVLAHYGVRAATSAIHFDMDDGTSYQIEHLDLLSEANNGPAEENDADTEMTNSTSDSQSLLANAIATSLRLLLLHAHSQNLARRSAIPAPITPSKHKTEEYQLLRPILAHLQHSHICSNLHTLFSNTVKIFQAAKLSADFSSSRLTSMDDARSPTTHATTPNTPPQSKSPSTALINSLLPPLESSLTLHLPDTSTISLRIRTALAEPSLGTEILFRAPKHEIVEILPASQDLEKRVCGLVWLVCGLSVAAVVVAGSSEKEQNGEEKERFWTPLSRAKILSDLDADSPVGQTASAAGNPNSNPDQTPQPILLLTNPAPGPTFVSEQALSLQFSLNQTGLKLLLARQEFGDDVSIKDGSGVRKEKGGGGFVKRVIDLEKIWGVNTEESGGTREGLVDVVKGIETKILGFRKQVGGKK